MKILFFSIFICLFTISPLWAQGQLIKGNVTDTNKHPVEGAFISLLKYPVKELLNSDISDSLGNFKFENLKNDSVGLFIRAMGYKDTILVISDHASEVRLASIALEPSSNTLLDEVIVKAKSYTIRKKVDRIVMGLMGNNELAKNNTVWGMLRYAPMIKIDEVQGLSMLGKENVEIYINGHKSKFSQDEIQSYLKGLPAGSIKNIELITNPGSTFNTGSNTGIINITLRKNETEGIKGTVSTQMWQTHYNKQIGVLNLNWVKGSWDLKSAFSARNLQDWSKSTQEAYFPQTEFIVNNSNTNKNKRQIYFGNIDVSYKLNKSQEIGVVVDFNIMNGHPLSRTVSEYSNKHYNQVDSVLSSAIDGKNSSDRIAVNLNYEINLNTKSRLRLDADYQFYKFNKRLLYQTDLLNLDGSIIKQYDYYRQHLPQTNNLWSGKAEYYFNSGDVHKFAAGIDGFYSSVDNKNLYQINKSDIGEGYNHINDNVFGYNETAVSGYFSHEAEWTKNFSTVVGVRLEHTSTEGRMQIPYEERTKHTYYKLLPSLSVSFVPSQNHYFWYSLTDRTDFPAYTYLNPFKAYRSATSYESGNPDLKPSRTINQELGYYLNSMYMFTLTQYTTFNAIDVFSRPVNNSVYDVTTPVNYGKEIGVRLGINLNQSFFHDYWYLNLSLLGQYSHYKSNVSFLDIDKRSFYGEININNTLILSKKYSWQLMGNYQLRTSQRRLTTKIQSDMRASLELRKSFKNCVLSFSGYRSWNYNDGRYCSERVLEYITKDLIRKSYSVGEYQGFMIKFVYNFGNRKIKNSQKHETTVSDQKNRFNDGN